MAELFLILATLSTGLFTGAAIYINLVEHPARMSCGTDVAVTEFRPSYKRATVMQASLAAFGTLNAVVAWFLDAGFSWLMTLAAWIPSSSSAKGQFSPIAPDNPSTATAQPSWRSRDAAVFRS